MRWLGFNICRTTKLRWRHQSQAHIGMSHCSHAKLWTKQTASVTDIGMTATSSFWVHFEAKPSGSYNQPCMRIATVESPRMQMGHPKHWDSSQQQHTTNITVPHNIETHIFIYIYIILYTQHTKKDQKSKHKHPKNLTLTATCASIWPGEFSNCCLWWWKKWAMVEDGPPFESECTLQKSNELIPKIAMFKGTYLFILGIQSLVFGGVNISLLSRRTIKY